MYVLTDLNFSKFDQSIIILETHFQFCSILCAVFFVNFFYEMGRKYITRSNFRIYTILSWAKSNSLGYFNVGKGFKSVGYQISCQPILSLNWDSEKRWGWSCISHHKIRNLFTRQQKKVWSKLNLLKELIFHGVYLAFFYAKKN